MVDNQIHCVIDNGSGFTKAGFSGEDSPRFMFPTIVGKTKVREVYVGYEKKEIIIGKEAHDKYGILDINYPITEGVITNWENMEKVWHHTIFSELKVPPEEQNFLLTESPLNQREDREKICQIMFEIFNVPCLYLSSQSALAAYSIGKSTAMVVDCGDGSTNLVPIYEGFLCRGAAKRIPIAGQKIHDLFIQALIKNGNNFESKAQKEYAKKAKDEFCYICQNYEDELKYFNAEQNTSEFILPDKKRIKIGTEKFEATEALFNPKKFGLNCNSLQDEMMLSLKLVDTCIREELLAQIVFNGGTSLLRGFKERSQREIEQAAIDYKGKKKVHFYPEAIFMSWIGGSLISSLSSFENLWITKSEYKESGANIVHRKCP